MVATNNTPKQLAALQLAASYANLLPNSDCQTKPHETKPHEYYYDKIYKLYA